MSSSDKSENQIPENIPQERMPSSSSQGSQLPEDKPRRRPAHARPPSDSGQASQLPTSQLQASLARVSQNNDSQAEGFQAKVIQTGTSPKKDSHSFSEGDLGCTVTEGSGVRTGKKLNLKKSRGRRVLQAVLAVMLVLLGSTVAYGAWLYNDLAHSLSYQGDTEALDAVLVDTNYDSPFYVLIIGSDSWQDYGARSDTMLLTRVDLENATITMVSVPRDTYYQIGDRTIKLNQVYAEGGEAACVKAVAGFTGVEISHYVEVEFDQLENVVDSLGGILVDVPRTIDYMVYTKDQPVVHIDAGEQLLNGNQAVALARMRTAYEGNPEGVNPEAIRQQNIRAMTIAMMKRVLEVPLNEIPGSIQTLASMVTTDIPLGELANWAMKIASAPKVRVHSCTGPNTGGIDVTTELWLTHEAPESWAALMKAVDSGKNPEGILTEDDIGSLKLQETSVIENPNSSGQ